MTDSRTNGRTLLHEMAREGNTEEVALLLAKGADIYAADSHGRTPLHDAAWAGDTESVTLLLNKGASINARDDFGRTALHEAAAEGYVETTAMLLNRGADSHIADKADEKPIHLAMHRKHEEIVSTLCAWEVDAQARGMSYSRFNFSNTTSMGASAEQKEVTSHTDEMDVTKNLARYARLAMTTPTTARRAELYALLGELPERSRPIKATTLAEVECEHYWLETLSLDVNGIEPVPAYFVRPKEWERRCPAILYNHAHGGNYVLGKDELLVANDYLQRPPYAEALARQGYAALCIDTWAFGERRGRSESSLFKFMLWHGQVLWGMMVYDNLRAFDYLAGRPEVDAARLGTLGISMGSTMAWWTAALEPRIKVCVDLCCLTDFQALIETQGLDGHGIYYYVPQLLKHFTSAQINALIAPRPHLALAGNDDPLTPPAGLQRIDEELRRVYREAGAPDAWQLRRYECGHLETAAMRAEVLAFLQQWL